MAKKKDPTFEERLAGIRERWFLLDPGYFMVLCTHEVEINPGIGCPIATGGGKIYINPDAYRERSDYFLEDALKAEIVRILLKHPYQRQLPHLIKMFLSSNFVLANNLDFKEMKMTKTREGLGKYDLDRASLEEIYDSITMPDMEGRGAGITCPGGAGGQGKNQQPGGGSGSGDGSGSSQQPGDDQDDGSGSGNNADGEGQQKDPLKNFDDGCLSTDDVIGRTQFWKEDILKITEINGIIDKIDKTRSWGSMPGSAIEEIKKSIEPKFNYKAIFQQFRSTVISSARNLTRMKPNRRFGYKAMGSKRDFVTKILVAIDNSGSISDDDLSLALGFINKFFRYGIDTIDTIQFDTEIHPETFLKMSKKIPKLKVYGRGGTDFNCVFNYAQKESPIYDGVIIFTDGYASVPDAKWLKNNYRNTRYIFCLNEETAFEHFRKNTGFAKFGKASYVPRMENGK